MPSVPAEMSAAERAQWLSDASAFLDEALRCLTGLQLDPAQHAEAVDLHHRIQAARFEARSLQASRVSRLRVEVDPKWTELFPPSNAATF